jgi:glycosyltransferase involved in cell wall biosynthesis
MLGSAISRLTLKMNAAPSDNLISIVIPAYNEEDVLHELHRRLKLVLNTLDMRHEIIYVDDGSKDATVEIIKSFRANDPSVGLIKLSRNFGKEIALTAGLHGTLGDCVIVIDADLQDPPELIPQMVAAWREGAEVVNMRRNSRAGETLFKKWSAHTYYRILNKLSDVPIPEDVGDFRLMSRKVIQALNALPESNRYMKGLFAWVGFQQVTQLYDRDARAAGLVKQNYPKLIGLALEGITSFSVKPLRIISLVGFMCALVAFGMTAFYLLKAIFMGDSVRGFPTLIVSLFFLGGLQLVSIGILGEYLGRMFIETKRRPLYFIDEQLLSHRPTGENK